MKDNELIEFRKLWITDMSSHPNPKELQGRSALELWIEGNEKERSRNSVEAIKLYRMAIKLDPDVERKHFELERKSVPNWGKVSEEQTTDNKIPNMEIVEEFSNEDSAFLMLPPDIHVQILKFLAVADINAIFNISLTCKQMSYSILKESIWRFACNYFHEFNVDVEVSKQTYQNSFLNLWIMKSRIRYDGVYVCTIKYQREGMSDPSLRLANLKTIHTVTYYRFKRFFPDNTCLIYTATADPDEVIPLLQKSYKPLKGSTLGSWKWVNDTVVVSWNGLKPNCILTATLKVFSTVKGLQNRLYWDSLIENSGSALYQFPRNQLDTFQFSKKNF